MSKTPIMILQEVMTKRNVLPVYDVISETSGTHVNSFTIRVKCEQLSAEGTATNKKEAKQKAAKEMLDLLDKAGKLDSSFLPSVKSDAVHSANVTSTSFVLDGNTVNHVGKLQEYCSVRKMPNPVYDVKNIIGQSHDAQFTMSCKVSKVEEEGSGRTKKIAKHNAAKKVIETLARTDSTLRFDSPKKSEKGLKRDLEGIGMAIKNLTLYESKHSTNASAGMAMDRYPELSKLPILVKKRVHAVKDYHKVLKDTIEVNNYNKLIKCLDYHLKSTPKMNWQDVLGEISTYLNTKFKLENVFISPTSKMQVACIQIDTNPKITEFASGPTSTQAEMWAFVKIMITLRILL